jgi:molecular chaperone GrpE
MEDAELSTVTPENTGTSAPQTQSDAEEQKKVFDELNDRYLRLAADFENYKRRIAREQRLSAEQAMERFAVEILEVVDNLERAQKNNDAHLREGIGQIQHLVAAIFDRHGIVPIESMGKQFNPAEHEAIAHIPSDLASGTVADVVSKGYRMHDRVIRYAKVAVSKGKEEKKEV